MTCLQIGRAHGWTRLHNVGTEHAFVSNPPLERHATMLVVQTEPTSAGRHRFDNGQTDDLGDDTYSVRCGRLKRRPVRDDQLRD